jgi:hypothetical protein
MKLTTWEKIILFIPLFGLIMGFYLIWKGKMSFFVIERNIGYYFISAAWHGFISWYVLFTVLKIL